jgi:hypothetical protein
MRGMSGGVIMLLAGLVMLYRGLAPQQVARLRGKRALFGLLSPGAQRVVLIVIGLISTLFGFLIFYQMVVS